MNDLHKEFTVLGLEPGAPFETVKRRYRRLALVWHPDRMTNAEAKREAEEGLKKINNSFDKLKKTLRDRTQIWTALPLPTSGGRPAAELQLTRRAGPQASAGGC